MQSLNLRMVKEIRLFDLKTKKIKDLADEFVPETREITMPKMPLWLDMALQLHMIC